MAWGGMLHEKNNPKLITVETNASLLSNVYKIERQHYYCADLSLSKSVSIYFTLMNNYLRHFFQKFMRVTMKRETFIVRDHR